MEREGRGRQRRVRKGRYEMRGGERRDGDPGGDQQSCLHLFHEYVDGDKSSLAKACEEDKLSIDKWRQDGTR